MRTPGPWKAVKGLEGDIEMGIDWSIETDEVGVAAIPPLCDGDHAANARLIAAAPELLEACEAMVDDLADRSKEGGTIRAIEKALAAIAKAKGEHNE